MKYQKKSPDGACASVYCDLNGTICWFKNRLLLVISQSNVPEALQQFLADFVPFKNVKRPTSNNDRIHVLKFSVSSSGENIA